MATNMKKFISEIEKQIYASLGVSKQLLNNNHIPTYGESLLKHTYIKLINYIKELKSY